MSSLSVVLVALAGCCLVVDACLIEITRFFEKVVGEPQVGFEADLAARVSLDDGFPDFEGFLVLADFESGVASLKEFPGGAILDDGTTLCLFLLGVGDSE